MFPKLILALNKPEILNGINLTIFSQIEDVYFSNEFYPNRTYLPNKLQ